MRSSSGINGSSTARCSGLDPTALFRGPAVGADARRCATRPRRHSRSTAGKASRAAISLQAFADEFGKGSERALQLLCHKDGDDAYLTRDPLAAALDAVEAAAGTSLIGHEQGRERELSGTV